MTRRLTEEAMAAEIESNRRSERWLIPKAIIALGLVAVLVVIRQLFFA